MADNDLSKVFAHRETDFRKNMQVSNQWYVHLGHSHILNQIHFDFLFQRHFMNDHDNQLKFIML